MNRLEKFLKSDKYILVVLITIFFFWAISYLSINSIINYKIIYIIENIEFIIIGLLMAFLLIFFKNTFYVIPWLMYIPFIFSRPFDVYSIPVCLYIGLSLFFIGVVINIIRFKPTLKFGAFFKGLLVLAIAFTLGGLLTKASYLVRQIVFSFFCSFALVFLYCFFSSTVEVDFSKIAKLLTCLGMLFIMQIVVYYAIQDSLIDSLLDKGINVGWGITNNIGLMLLMTIPFTIYLAQSKSGFKTFGYLMLSFIEILAVVFTYSRGSIIAMVIGLIIYFPICFIFSKDKWTFIPIVNIFCLSLFFFLSYASKYLPEYFERFHEYVLKIDLTSINGRVPTYKKIMEVYQEQPIFGYGMFAPFETAGEESKYIWGHSTFMHTLYTMGFVGVACLMYHLTEKYLLLFRKINMKKTAVIFSLAISGLYGLFDVSYYFICYMVVLILLLAIIEKEVSSFGVTNENI